VFYYYYEEKIVAKGATRLLSQIGIQISKCTTFRVHGPVWRLIEAFVGRQVFTETFKGIVEIDEVLFTHRAGPGWRVCSCSSAK